MSIRSRRALGALAAVALSGLSVVGLQATAAVAGPFDPPGGAMKCIYHVDIDAYVCSPGVIPEPSAPDADGNDRFIAHGADPVSAVSASHECFVDGLQVGCTEDEYIVFPERPGDRDRVLPPSSVDEGADVVTAVATVTSDAAGRPVEQNPTKPIWCTDTYTGEVFLCGSQSMTV